MKLLNLTEVTGASRELGMTRSFKAQSVTGTAYASFDGENEIELEDGFTVELPVGMFFKSVVVRPSNGSSAKVLSGMASFGSSGGSGTAGEVGTGSPEAAVTAEPGTTYYDTAAASFWVKATGTGNTGWVQLIA